MKIPNLNTSCLLAIGLLAACTKNSSPKTIYDTVTVTKTDTLQLPPPDDTPNLTNGLVLYLPFTNGSYADSSGLGNVVTAINGATLGYDMHGYAKSAFNETGNYAVLDVANNGSYAVDTAFSVSLDFMIRSYPYYPGDGNYSGLQSLLSIASPNGPEATSITFNIGFGDPDVPTVFTFGVNGSNAVCGSTAPNPENVWDITSFTPQLGAWYNAICTYTQGIGSVYINGNLMVSKRVTSTDSALFCPDAHFTVGGVSGGEAVNGEIDEVRFYNRTLTTQQIAWLSRNFQINSTARKPGLQRGGSPGLN
jgi:hypothetical protein